ncbi:sensor histidine kinase [Petropleomorpha daqingensis]|uniref:histidine kinase n=1 Tax=Petropleomorpha daqingensis TaxID=2026353 RepID=A0A853CA00_9ACTN|nr:signal transduction histidine kinase [Petropleomorpha daqingensis]
MQLLRDRALDAFVVLLAAVEVASVLAADPPRAAAAAVVSAVSALVLLAHRWQPLAACVAAFAALTLSVALTPRSTLPQFFGTLATFAIAGAVNREREAVVAWLAGAGMLAYAAWVDPVGGGLGDFALSLAFGTTMWGAGLLVARRARSTAAAVRRAEDAERDRLEQGRRAVEEERARIARELHDVVSHGLSVVVLQTVAARAALHDGEPAAAVDRHLDAVEETARDSLGDMRRMLGLLQADDADGPSAPAPGLSSLPALVDRASAGLRIGAVDVDTGAELPGGIELAVYRIVQEALTNAAKHAPGSSVAVRVQVADGRVTASVVNTAGGPGPTVPGSGRGLVGMRERVALYGGTLAAGPTADGYALTASLPLDADVVAAP